MTAKKRDMVAAVTTQTGTARRQLPRYLGGVICLFDVLMIAFGFACTKLLSLSLVHLSAMFEWGIDFHHFDTRRYYYVFLSLCIILRFAAKGHYSRRPPWLLQVEGILKTVAFAAIFDCFNFYFLGKGVFPQLILVNWFLCAVFLTIGRYAALFVVSHFKGWKLPIVLVGDSRTVMDSFYAFQSDGHTGYDVKVVLLTEEGDTAFDLGFLPKAQRASIALRRDADGFDRFIQDHRDYYYIFSMDDLRGPYGGRFRHALDVSQVEYAVIPHTRTLDVYGMEPHYFFGNDVMILHRRDPIRSPSGRVLKRLLDIVVTGMAVPVLGVLTIIVWAAKKIEKSDTPVFYGGARVGMDGKLFNCWKFCTMRRDADAILDEVLAKDPALKAEWDQFQKLKDDPRIDSKISKLLRKTSLDELPQLWNVFVGDMSLVGPRPILPFQKEGYGDMIEEYYAVRPGLTGLWQVSGRNETSFQQRIYWDGWYIRNWSLWYDIVIIFKTVRVLLTGSGAY